MDCQAVIVRERMIDEAVLRVIRRGFIQQGYQGVVQTNLATIRDWFEDGCKYTAWWFAFVSHVQAEYRAILLGQA